MKKLIFSGMALLLTTFIAVNASAQVVTRNVSGYTGIACGGPFNVFIKIDGTESIKLDVQRAIGVFNKKFLRLETNSGKN